MTAALTGRVLHLRFFASFLKLLLAFLQGLLRPFTNLEHADVERRRREFECAEKSAIGGRE